MSGISITWFCIACFCALLVGVLFAILLKCLFTQRPLARITDISDDVAQYTFSAKGSRGYLMWHLDPCREIQTRDDGEYMWFAPGDESETFIVKLVAYVGDQISVDLMQVEHVVDGRQSERTMSDKVKK